MILGIDCGITGALAFLNDDELLIYDIPVFEIERNGKKKKQIDHAKLWGILHVSKIEKAFVESVSAMPGQGVTSMFSMGRTFGAIEMALAASYIPTEYISPQVWKKKMGLSKDKDSSRHKASLLMPQWAHNWDRKKDHNRAEAALIALYGKNKINQKEC